MKKYPVITLCGSTRFKDDFERMMKELTLRGNIVISVGLFGHAGDQEVWEGMSEGQLTQTKMMLDDMHKSKIVDPWLREDTQGEAWVWEEHRNPDYGVNPFEYYGKKKTARFIESILMKRGEL